jgi:hypothetical protein
MIEQTESVLDLVLPHQLVSTVKYQADVEDSCWEQRHIDAMNVTCEYIALTYPELYSQVRRVHDRFKNMTPDY